jgi:hypothetical protein
MKKTPTRKKGSLPSLMTVSVTRTNTQSLQLQGSDLRIETETYSGYDFEMS